jgi:hypothetical protein
MDKIIKRGAKKPRIPHSVGRACPSWIAGFYDVEKGVRLRDSVDIALCDLEKASDYSNRNTLFPEHGGLGQTALPPESAVWDRLPYHLNRRSGTDRPPMVGGLGRPPYLVTLLKALPCARCSRRNRRGVTPV